MGEQAAGTFEISGWDEAPYDVRDRVRLSRALATKTFSGGVEGESVAELLLAYGAEEGSAAYTGLERVVGRVQHRPPGPGATRDRYCEKPLMRATRRGSAGPYGS